MPNGIGEDSRRTFADSKTEGELKFVPEMAPVSGLQLRHLLGLLLFVSFILVSILLNSFFFFFSDIYIIKDVLSQRDLVSK
jgi:hypothetical protein